MAVQLRVALVFVIATAVSSVSLVAQTDSSGARLVLARTSSTAVRPYDASPGATLEGIPPNLLVPSFYSGVIDRLRRDSPTFRRQCARIAAAPQLLVTIVVDPPQHVERPAAITYMVRHEAGRVRAQVRVPSTPRTAELIAHELEHVLEQLDGVDLRAKSQLKATGVHSCECGERSAVYETARAIAAGRRVAEELERAARR